MIQPVRLTTLAVAAATLILSGCFSSNPARQSEGGSEGQGSTSSGSTQSSSPSSTSSSSSSQSGSQGQSTTQGRTAPNSTATAPQGGSTPTRETRQGSSSTSQQPGGRTDGNPGGQDGSADIRVAKAERAGAGTDAPAAPESDVGGTDGSISDTPEVGVAEALEGANAAVDAATEAVSEAETAIERAREVADEAAGGGDVDTFDPWAKPGGGAESADSATAGGGGGQPADAAEDSSDAARPGQSSDTTSGPREQTARAGGSSAGEENFDPFADYNEPASGGPGRPDGVPATGSLEIADDALAAARAALERARRALITAADAGRPGSGDADAEAVQLEAARAAMEAAAEAVIASAIAVMAASEAYTPEDYDEDPSSDSEDLLAENVARVVAIVQRDMRNAADALDATGELLAAAGNLMAVLGQVDDPRMADESDGASEEPGDRVASLEEQLDRSLAVFDDRMNAEGSTIVRGMGGEDSEITAAAAAASAENASASRQTGDPRSERGVMDGAVDRPDVDWNEPRNTTRVRDPEVLADRDEEYDIEDSVAPQDDDIIARQLREAALAEQDPELREALWQEYVAYKDSLEAESN